MKHFKDINCIEDLKRQYFALAKKFHSDITGGSDEAMKDLNSEYAALHAKFKDVHASIKKDAEPYYTAKASTSEAPEDFINIIRFLLGLKGLEIELCGRWIWITGNTKAHKDILGSMGCKWSGNKLAWSWHYAGDDAGYRKRGTSLADIRNTYGSLSFKTDETLLIS